MFYKSLWDFFQHIQIAHKTTILSMSFPPSLFCRCASVSSLVLSTSNKFPSSNFLNALMRYQPKFLPHGYISTSGVSVCVLMFVWPYTAWWTAAVTAEFVFITVKSLKTNLLPLYPKTGSGSSFSHAIGSSLQPAASYWPFQVVAWLHQKLVYLSRAQGFSAAALVQTVQSETTSHFQEKAHSKDASVCSRLIFLLLRWTCWCWRWLLKVIKWDNQPTPYSVSQGCSKNKQDWKKITRKTDERWTEACQKLNNQPKGKEFVPSSQQCWGLRKHKKGAEADFSGTAKKKGTPSTEKLPETPNW